MRYVRRHTISTADEGVVVESLEYDDRSAAGQMSSRSPCVVNARRTVFSAGMWLAPRPSGPKA